MKWYFCNNFIILKTSIWLQVLENTVVVGNDFNTLPVPRLVGNLLCKTHIVHQTLNPRKLEIFFNLIIYIRLKRNYFLQYLNRTLSSKNIEPCIYGFLFLKVVCVIRNILWSKISLPIYDLLLKFNKMAFW